jgi:hypothetical protein
MTDASRFLIGLVTCFATHGGITLSRAQRGAGGCWAECRYLCYFMPPEDSVSALS